MEVHSTVLHVGEPTSHKVRNTRMTSHYKGLPWLEAIRRFFQTPRLTVLPREGGAAQKVGQGGGQIHTQRHGLQEYPPHREVESSTRMISHSRGLSSSNAWPPFFQSPPIAMLPDKKGAGKWLGTKVRVFLSSFELHGLKKVGQSKEVERHVRSSLSQ